MKSLRPQEGDDKVRVLSHLCTTPFGVNSKTKTEACCVVLIGLDIDI